MGRLCPGGPCIRSISRRSMSISFCCDALIVWSCRMRSLWRWCSEIADAVLASWEYVHKDSG
jgi:hypothetical protein